MKNKNNIAKVHVMENSNVPFDLHFISSELKRMVPGEDHKVEMDRYFGKGMIMDFYKNNSNMFYNE